uniref:Chromosome 10 C12orf74 homolog n=1 Tax=Rhinopithecus roxellana TaxID=61622 RepID=A0A2K6RHD9_RHIRO
MEKTESFYLEVPPKDCGASPQPRLRSLPKQHCENQGSLLQFDRQAPGRISTSPTLRRLRTRGCGTWHSLSQQDALQVPTWGSWREPEGSPCYLSKSLPGSPKDSSYLLSPLRLHSRLTSEPERALNAADSREPQTRPTDKCLPPELQPVSEESLPQASLLRQEGHFLSSPTLQRPSPQGEELHPSRVCIYFLQCYDIC